MNSTNEQSVLSLYDRGYNQSLIKYNPFDAPPSTLLNTTSNQVASSNLSAGPITDVLNFESYNYTGSLAAGSIQWNIDTGEIVAGTGVVIHKGGIKGAAGGVVTFELDATTGDATFTGSITGSTITGGTFQTAASGKRVVISAATNTLKFFDSTAEVIGIGTETSTAMRVDLNSVTTNGIRVFGTLATQVGYYYQNSGAVANIGLDINMTGGTGNNLPGIRINHDGNGSGIDIDVTNSSLGINITTTSDQNALKIQGTRAGSQTLLNLFKSSSTGSSPLSIFESDDGGILLDIRGNASGSSNPVVKILSESDSASSPALFIDKNGSQYAIDIDQDANDGSNTIGIKMNIANAGAGNEFAFEFAGSEVVGSAVGGTQNKKIRVLAGGGVYYIPCYDA